MRILGKPNLGKRIRVILAEEASEAYEGLKGIVDKERHKGIKSSENQTLLRGIENAIELLKYNVQCGKQVPKKQIPKKYVDRYGAKNLWRMNLPPLLEADLHYNPFKFYGSCIRKDDQDLLKPPRTGCFLFFDALSLTMAKGEKIDKETRRRLEEFLRPGREEDFGLACKIIRDPKFMIWFPEHDIARNIQDLHKLSKQLGWPIPEDVQARIREIMPQMRTGRRKYETSLRSKGLTNRQIKKLRHHIDPVEGVKRGMHKKKRR